MPLPYLAAELRKADPDRYLLSLFAQPDRREALWALFLFNHEIAKTRDVVSDTTLGLIRLQWWRDEIAKIYAGGSGGQNAVLSTLAKAVGQYDLPQDLFDTLIYAREFDLEDVSPENLNGLRHYCDFTTTPLTKLMMKVAGEEAEDEVVTQIAVNYAVVGLGRSVPYMLSNGRCFIPSDFLVLRNLDVRKIQQGNEKEVIIEGIKTMISLFDSYRKPLPRLLKKQSAIASIYMKQLKKSGFDVFSQKMQMPPSFLTLRVAFDLV